jgi:hypothetical protein
MAAVEQDVFQDPVPGDAATPGAVPQTPARGYPSDKILCQGRFLRYLVACLHNCPSRNRCPEFKEFFKARGLTPLQWAQQIGVAEDVMKRIVFDCDRCGKKDVGEPWSAFQTSGPDEGRPLAPADFRALAERAAIPDGVDAFVGQVLGLLRDGQGMEHYCEACFRKVAGLAVAIVGKPTAIARPVAAVESAMSPAARALSGGRPALLDLADAEHVAPAPVRAPAPARAAAPVRAPAPAPARAQAAAAGRKRAL